MLKSLVNDLLYMIIRQRIIHDLGLSSEFDQSGKPECFQLVRDRRFGDAQQNRKVAYTHLALFQSMKDLHSCAISEQLEKLYKSLGEMKELSNGVTSNVTTLKLDIIVFRLHFAFYIVHDVLMDHIAITGV